VKQVFLVTQGEYSEYSVLGAFDTKEHAQEYIDAWETPENSAYDNEMEILPMEMNPTLKEVRKGLKAFEVRMRYDGSVIDVEKEETPSGSAIDVNYCINYSDKKKFIMVNCFAKDEKHAIKITNEKRTQGIALDKWAKR
jgi:hypothetical protein